MRQRIVAAIGLGLALASCNAARKAPEAPVILENAWVRLPAAPGRPGAAYFTLRSNRGAYTLDSLQSPQVARIELHDSSMQGGMMQMSALPAATFDQDRALVFEPEGKHAMLFGIDSGVKSGDTIQMGFTFSPGQALRADVPVVAAGEDPPHGGAH